MQFGWVMGPTVWEIRKDTQLNSRTGAEGYCLFRIRPGTQAGMMVALGSMKVALVRGAKGDQPGLRTQSPKTYAKIKGATIEASELIMNLGVSASSLHQVIFSLGTAPE